jgi:hypothetical protein
VDSKGETRRWWVGTIIALVAVLIALLAWRLPISPSPDTTTGPPQPSTSFATPTSPVTSIYLEDLSPTGDPPLTGVASIQGHMFPHSLEYEISLIGDHKTSTFALNGRYRRFRAYLGIDPRDSTFGSPVTFDIYVDGRRVSAGTPIDPNAGPCELDLSVTNATSLTLDMKIGGEGLGRDYAAFGDARLIGAKDIRGEPTLPACAQNPDAAS